MLRRVHQTAMADAGRMHAQKIGILGEDHTLLLERQREVLLIRSGVQPGFRRSQHVNPATAQSGHHGFSDMLVRVEFDPISH